MSSQQQESNAYILGTERAELHRLGLQHQVWASEARNGWDFAEFSEGQVILDLGCGPGFCTMELAYMVGPEGRVIGVDKSAHFIDFLKQQAALHQLDIQLQCSDFEEMKLPDEMLDGAYCRWALCWLDDPMPTIQKIADALKPGGAFVAHEYFDWQTWQSEPGPSALKHAIAQAYKRFGDSGIDIDVGRRLPGLFEQAGLEVIRKRPMAKLATPDNLNWQWPRTFMEVYFPKLVEADYLNEAELEQAFEDLAELEDTSGAVMLCPTMYEVIAVKL